MTIEAVAWARERHVPGDAGRVLEALANYANHRTGRIEFDPDWIAEEACISPNAVPRYVAALRRNGYLATESKGKDKCHWLRIGSAPTGKWSWDAAESDAESDDAPSPRI